MNLNINYNKHKINYTVINNIIKIYTVPTEYMDNGLFFADYKFTDIEILPECYSYDTKLVFHAVVNGDGTPTVYLNDIKAKIKMDS